MINDTIISVRTHLLGLHPDTPFIIAIDGLKSSATDDDRRRYDEMVDNLHTTYTSALVLTKNASEGLTKNIQKSIGYVQTKYLYLVQHDLIFALDINHTAMVKTFEEYPGLMNVVRFNLRKNMFRFSDRRYPCFGENSPMNNVNGIHFTKTGHWSDNNQFSSKQYYIDLFRDHFTSAHQLTVPMEYRMTHVTAANCSYEGPWLYGRKRSGPWVIHLDGKRTTSYFGNMTNITVSGHYWSVKEGTN